MGIINIQTWQFLLFVAVTWLWGYIFGFSNGRTYGANETLRHYFKKKQHINTKTTTVAVAKVIKDWKDMGESEKLEAWNRADDDLKAYYLNNMTNEEKRRYK